jgi:ATP-dependent Zn protease
MKMALRAGRSKATIEDFEAAIDRILIGIPRKAQIISEKEKLLTAYHEGGHTICSLLTKGS